MTKEPRKQKKTWAEMSPSWRVAVVVLGVVQVALSAAAWTDLVRRDAGQVRGSKRAWAFAIALNFVGPVEYFRRGRLEGRRVELDS